MFRHTLLLAYRSFLRFKSTFFINLIGLSTGLAGALLIYLWVSDELAVDKFHEKDKQLFQVMNNIRFSGSSEIETSEWTPYPLAQALQAEMPEVESTVSVFPYTGGKEGILSVGDAHTKAKEQYAGPNFFTIFSYPLLQGDKQKVLQDKHAVVISDELAYKLFHSLENVIGKTVEWEQDKFSGVYLISGIFKKPSQHSTAAFDLVFPFALFREKTSSVDEWSEYGCINYIVLKQGTNPEQFNKKIGLFLQKKSKVNYQQTLFLSPYSDKYLHGKYENGQQVGGRITYVKLFSIIAVFVILVACINFMNLSTAKASRRIKEVGVKKALGASRNTLIYQYLGESLVVTLLSLLLAILLVILFLPQFNQITGKQLALYLDARLILSCLGIALGTGLIAGSYPALYLSGFHPVTVLKGKLPTRVGEVLVRKGLVVFQFALSVIFLVSVWVVYKQIGLIQTKNLGYNRDNIVMLKKEGKLNKSLEVFLQEVKKIPGVVNASNTWGSMTKGDNYTGGLDWEGKTPNENITFASLQGNYNLTQTLGIKLKQGRTFLKNYGADSTKILFNEAAIELMGLQDPVGKTIKLWGKDRQIIGVVKNFHFESLYEKVKPCFLILEPKADNIVIKIKVGTEKETLKRIEALYRKFNPGLAFDYRFMDEDYQALYAAEQRVAVLSRYFAGLAVLISCLGLFGLAAFTAERRRKEIGVRKVLGASRFSIVYLLSSDFTKLVGVAIFLSLPLSYLLVKHWLQNFEYRIALEWWYFAGAGLTALIITWLTVSTQAVKAASANPVHSLKEE